MKTSSKTPFARGSALAVAALALLAVMALPGAAQSPDTGARVTAPEPAVTPPAPRARPRVDLRTLWQQELLQASPGNTRVAPLSITGKKDGTLEVRDRAGKLIAVYPPHKYALFGRVSTEALERINEERAALEEEYAGRKQAADEADKRQREADKAAESGERKAAKEKEAKWNADLASKSDSYKANSIDGTGGEAVKAVPIDAREIRKDGTYTYNGRNVKPVQLWSPSRLQYEMAIPVEKP